VSSIMMGFGWGTGGLSVPFVGLIADRIGIEWTLTGLAVVPLVAAACALPLPSRAHVPAPHRPAELAVADTDL
jgi:FSR family fosmidomycin resistance protein-like MFS transporter